MLFFVTISLNSQDTSVICLSLFEKIDAVEPRFIDGVENDENSSLTTDGPEEFRFKEKTYFTIIS